ncbi:hypothetical protein M5D96_005875 [Drosophila gunungcola]|uniref:CAP-Gly domain-containing protein n=2 Tax=Drosophila gunungcola TaxID=103775 RepID=A0A9P9YRK8_9MUSC|nr:hypothetical protein M5D96_005875 [Drosophila gunungcola]
MSPRELKLGQRVEVTGKNLQGRIAYVGRTTFAAGLWYGVVLDEPLGKNNGSIHGSIYFKCPPNCGLFVRAQQLVRIAAELPPGADDNRKADEMQRDGARAKLSRRTGGGGRSVEEQDNQREQVASTSGKAKAATPSTSSTPSPQHRSRNGQSSREQALAKTSGKFLAAQQQPLQLPKNPMVSEGNARSSQLEEVEKVNMSPKKSSATEQAQELPKQESKDAPQPVRRENEPVEKEEEQPSTGQLAKPSQETNAIPLQTSTIGELPAQKAAGQLIPPIMTCNQRRSTSYTQLRPTRISQPKPTTAQA